jgi:acyl carrier protein
MVMVLESLKHFFVETMDIEEESVTVDSNLRNDIGIEDGDIEELVDYVELEFGVEIDSWYEDFDENFKTLKDLVEYIEQEM